ncbi:hypothetical protein BDAP_002801 [Binucleata daphniae]
MKVLKKQVRFVSKAEVKQIIGENQNVVGNEDQETIKLTTLEYCNTNTAYHTNNVIEYLREMNLTEFEIYQLIDLKPKTLLCLQLVIEEMEERYSKEKLEEILTMFNSE